MNDFKCVLSNDSNQVILFLDFADSVTMNEKKIYVVFVQNLNEGMKLSRVYEFDTNKFRLD